jgi:hypothetical protein
VIYPALIFGSSVAAYRTERNYFLAKYTRDAAQLMFLLITILGLIGFNTNIVFRSKKITLDLISVGILDLCCTVMSISFLQDTLAKNVLALLDITANFAAFTSLAAIATPYLYK